MNWSPFEATAGSSKRYGGDWTNVSTGMDIIQYYGGTALDVNRILGGAQDNGTTGNFDYLPLPAAAQYLDGDGTYTAIDTNNLSDALWASYPGLGILRGHQGSPFSFKPAAPCSTGTEPACSDPVEFVAPFLHDPVNTGELIAGTSKVYQTYNDGNPGTWNPISNDLVNPRLVGRDALQQLAMAGSDIMTASTASQTWSVATTNCSTRNLEKKPTKNGMPAIENMTMAIMAAQPEPVAGKCG